MTMFARLNTIAYPYIVEVNSERAREFTPLIMAYIQGYSLSARCARSPRWEWQDTASRPASIRELFVPGTPCRCVRARRPQRI
jgi:hypothetical protein